MTTATAEVVQVDDAVEWFRSRIPVTETLLAEIGDYASNRAFWISGVAQLSVVLDVYESLDHAVATGTPFDEWKKNVEPRLTAAWGRKNSPRVETIFRNATQQAYNAGRFRQMTDPDVLRLRPMWEFDGIADSRQSPICAECDGVVLEATDPWWQSHTPQLHHRCRSRIRSLRRNQKPATPTGSVPRTQAQAGFGRIPTENGMVTPTIPSGLSKIAPTKLRAVKAPQYKAPKVNPDHKVKRWEKLYERDERELGDAVKAIAWGRTMEERGLDLTARQVAATLSEAQGSWPSEGFARMRLAVLKLDQDQPLRSQLEASPHISAAGAIAAHMRAIKPAKALTLTGLGPDTPEGAEALKRARDWFRRMTDKTVAHPVDWSFGEIAGRGFQDARAKRIGFGLADLPSGVLHHEWAHALESLAESRSKVALAFRKARTRGEKLRKLSELHPDYSDSELAYFDDWADPYTGKRYSWSWSEGGSASEITSMGVEALWRSPSRARARDKELFWLTLGQLR